MSLLKCPCVSPAGLEPPAAAALPLTLSCGGNGTPNPRRVSIAIYPPSIPAIKSNGRAKHIANVLWSQTPEKCGDRRIHQWNCALTCPTNLGRATELTYPKSIEHTDSCARRRRRQTAAVCSMLENHNPRSNVFSNKWQFVKFRLKSQQKGILQPNGDLFSPGKPAITLSAQKSSLTVVSSCARWTLLSNSRQEDRSLVFCNKVWHYSKSTDVFLASNRRSMSLFPSFMWKCCN